MKLHKLLIVTAVAGLSIVTIAAWQNRPCGESCRAAKLKEFQQQMVKCTALVQPFGKPLGQLPERTERTLGKAIGKAMIAVTNIQEAAERERGRANKGNSERSRHTDDE